MILLLASEHLESFEIGNRDDGEVLVVAPALVDRLRYWTSDDDRARRAAARRLDGCLASLRRRGLKARGYVADADPLQALDDALRLFGPHEIVVALHAHRRANWRARDLVRRAERRFGCRIRQTPLEPRRPRGAVQSPRDAAADPPRARAGSPGGRLQHRALHLQGRADREVPA